MSKLSNPKGYLLLVTCYLLLATSFSLVLELASAIATLIAEPLSDRILEPAMQSETILSSLFAPMFGNGAGAGMALLYVSCAIAMVLIGTVGYQLPQLNRLDNRGSQE